MPQQGDNIRIVAHGNLPSQAHTWECTWVWRVTAVSQTGSLPNWLNVLVASLSDAFLQGGNHLARWTNDGFSISGFRALNLNTPTEEATNVQNWRGEYRIGYSMPPEATSVVHLSTGLAGRSYAGRIYWPFTEARQQEAGVQTSNYIAALNRFFRVVRFAGNAQDNGVLAVWSRALSTDDVVFTTPVTTTNIRPRVYWQRRRG
jgi:hypothetical protein